ETPSAPGRAVPPAPRLADVVRGDGPTGAVSVDDRAGPATARGRRADAQAPASQPIPRPSTRRRARPPLPLPVHKPRRTPRHSRVVGADPGRAVAPAPRPRHERGAHRFGNG